MYFNLNEKGIFNIWNVNKDITFKRLNNPSLTTGKELKCFIRK